MPRRARRRARGRRRRARWTPTGSPACTCPVTQLNTDRGLRRRVPPRRQHGALGAAGAAAGRDRPAGDRERRQPRLPGRVPRRRGRPGDGLLGHRGRGQAAQVPADVPRLRARGGQQDRPARRTSTSTSTCCCTTSTRCTPDVRDDARQRAHRRGRRRRARLARASCAGRGRGPPRDAVAGPTRCAPRVDARARRAHARRRARSSRPRPSALARLCHAMAERFARGGRLIAVGARRRRALRRRATSPSSSCTR